MKRLSLIIILALLTLNTNAQTIQELSQKVDSLEKLQADNKKSINKFQNWLQTSWVKNFKLSGYMQVQWQMAQTKGADAMYNGGNFGDEMDNRIMIRRGRVKLGYKLDYFSAAIQINATEKGVSLTQANMNFHLPNEIFTANFGMMTSNFSMHLPYSSTNRIEAERPRVISALIANPFILGANVTLRGKKETALNDLRLDIGVFTSNWGKLDTYSRKRIMAKLDYQTTYDNNIMWGLSSSFHRGGLPNVSDKSYSYDKSQQKYIEKTGVQGKMNNSLYYSIGGKFGFKTVIGQTEFWGEYLCGTMPGTLSANYAIKDESKLAGMGDIYNRKFEGFYTTMIHKIPYTNLSFVARFDKYNPNKEISGDMIGLAQGSSIQDISYSTVGTGLAYDFLKNHLRVLVYYEFIWNEQTANIAEYNTNLKDNLLTIRLQAKF